MVPGNRVSAVLCSTDLETSQREVEARARLTLSRLCPARPKGAPPYERDGRQSEMRGSAPLDPAIRRAAWGVSKTGRGRR